MNDTFLNTLLELSEDNDIDVRPSSGHRPSSVLFSRPPSSILVSRPPSAAIMTRPHSALRVKRPPSTSTLKQPRRKGHLLARPPSASTIGRPASSVLTRRPNPMKCGVCTDGFSFPGNVPCFDSFCAQCLEEHVLTFKRGTGCNCPLCKSGILLPKASGNKKSAKSSDKSNLTVCQTCEGARLAQYKCNMCEEYFCEKCNRDFLKRMRIDSNFNVSHLSSLSGDNCAPMIMAEGMDDDSLDSISLPSLLPKGFGFRCQNHEEEELRFFCDECKVAICRDCKILKHEGHATTALEDQYEEEKHNLSKAVKQSNTNIRKLHLECTEINSKRLEIDQETREAVSMIENQANEIKSAVEQMSKDMINKIRSQNNASRGTLLECRDAVKEKVTSLQTLIEKASALLEEDNGLEIVNQGRSLAAAMNDADISSTAEKLWRRKYVFDKPAGTVEDTSPGRWFGRLQTISEGLIREVPAVELQMVSTFGCDERYKQTTSVAPLSDNTAWVCTGFRNKIHRYDTEGQLQQSDTLDFDVDDMVDGLAGKLFLTEFNGKVIRKLSNNNKLSIFARTDLYLRGITLSLDGSRVVACGNDVPVACLRDAEVCKVVVFNMKGKLVKEIVIDVGMKGVSLFRICHTISDEYVISTGLSSLYFIVGCESGKVKYRYQSSSSADGVACDEHGLIYMSACKGDTLYLLNSKGVPLPTTYAMHKPTAVAIDRNNVIWVGDWSKVHVLKYKQ